MPERVFIQRSRFGRTIFVLREAEIEVSTSGPNAPRTVTFPLRAISTDYAVSRLNFKLAVTARFALAAAGVAVAFFLGRLGEPFNHFAVKAVVFSGAMAMAGIKFIPQLELFTFSDQGKRPLFSVMREPGQADECDTFVSDLLTRIERASASPNSVTTGFPIDFGEAIDTEPEWKWQAALVSGAAALVAAIAGNLYPEASDIAFLSVLGGSMCVAATSWLSFSDNERWRRWSLLGVALALVAVGLGML